MRLHEKEIKILKDKIHTIAEDAKLYLFGSRVDDSKKGGDIDLLILSDKITKKDLRLVRIEFFEHFGEQKLDIILDDKTSKSPFTRHILQKAIEL